MKQTLFGRPQILIILISLPLFGAACGVFEPQSKPGSDPYGICRRKVVSDFNSVEDAVDRYELHTLAQQSEGLRCQQLDLIINGTTAIEKKLGKNFSCEATNGVEVVELKNQYLRDIRDDHSGIAQALCRGVQRLRNSGQVVANPPPPELSPCEQDVFTAEENIRVALLELMTTALRRADKEKKIAPRSFRNFYYCRDLAQVERMMRDFDNKYGRQFVCDRSAEAGDQPIGDRYYALAEKLADRSEVMSCDQCKKDVQDRSLPVESCIGFVWDQPR